MAKAKTKTQLDLELVDANRTIEDLRRQLDVMQSRWDPRRVSHEQAASWVTDYLNVHSEHDRFAKAMMSEHRTLQQRFTTLCMRWIWHNGQPDVPHDLRNEHTVKWSRSLVEGKDTYDFMCPFI